MNLCIVSSGDFFSDYGGGQVYVRNIVDAFIVKKQEWNLQLSVISCHPKINETTKKNYLGITVYETYPNGDIESLLSKIKPDLVHANGEKLLFAKTCKKLGIPCIVTVHHGGVICPAGTLLNTDDKICSIPSDYSHCLKCYLRKTPTGLFWHPLLKQFSQQSLNRIGQHLKKLPFIPFLSPIGETGMIVSQKLKDWNELSETATHFIAPSNAIADALIRNRCSESKITVIPHGIPTNEIQNSKFKIQNSKLISFYYVGRINYVKGIHILLESFSSIDNPNIRLHLIGGAVNKAEMRYMKQLQRKYHSDHRIIWHGKIPSKQMEEVIKDFHCLVHPAIYLEVFGLNISEALAQHKYVIATRCGGPEMQIHNDDDGFLVAPNNKKELVDAIIKYIDDPHPSKTQIDGIKTHVDSLVKVYNEVMYNK